MRSTKENEVHGRGLLITINATLKGLNITFLFTLFNPLRGCSLRFVNPELRTSLPIRIAHGSIRPCSGYSDSTPPESASLFTK